MSNNSNLQLTVEGREKGKGGVVQKVIIYIVSISFQIKNIGIMFVVIMMGLYPLQFLVKKILNGLSTKLMEQQREYYYLIQFLKEILIVHTNY